MQIHIIAALTPNHLIGGNNNLLWHLPDDLKHFKALTINKPIIMGRNTYDSLGKPLPKRQNIVITRDQHWQADGVEVAHSGEEALTAAGDAPEVMIIGGAQIYALFLPTTQYLHLTWVDYQGDGDTYFPDLNLNEWQVISEESHPIDAKHAYAFRFVNYARRVGI